jgi:hypothetical protein
MRLPITLLLALPLFAGCATGGDPARPSDDEAELDRMAEELDDSCRRRAAVTVHVDNRSSFDVSISFGSYAPARPALGFARTTYAVPRTYLEGRNILLRIERGGLSVERPAVIQTEYVVCNDATLLIGSRPRYSFFYGDLFEKPTPGTEDDAGDGASDSSSVPEPTRGR